MLGSFWVWRTITEMCAALLWREGAEQLWFHSHDTGDTLGGLQLPVPLPCYIQQNVDSRVLKSTWIQWIAIKIIVSLKLENCFQSFFNLKDFRQSKILEFKTSQILNFFMLAKETFHVSGQTNPHFWFSQEIKSNIVNHGSNNFYCYPSTC